MSRDEYLPPKDLSQYAAIRRFAAAHEEPYMLVCWECPAAVAPLWTKQITFDALAAAEEHGRTAHPDDPTFTINPPT